MNEFAFRPHTGLTPELRASFFHFSVFLSVGVASVYFSIWLSGQGYSPEQIGLTNAIPVIVTMLVNLFVGRIADRASDWRGTIIALSVVAGIAPFGLFVVSGFWGTVIVWTVVSVSAGMIAPLIDAATVRMAQRNGTDFGTIRAWGTVGYMSIVGGGGMVFAAFGPVAFVPMLVAMSLVRTALAFQLPRFRAPASAGQPAPIVGAVELRGLLKPWFILPILAFALIQSTHALLGTFGGLAWKSEGIGEGTIGWLLALAAAAEAAMMFLWRRANFRFSARYMIMIAGGATVLRWSVMALSPQIEILFAVQLLHAFTYGMGYFGLVLFIANWTDESIAAQAQGFGFVLMQGVTVLVLVSFGSLFDLFGILSFFFAAGLGATAMACVVASLLLKPVRHEKGGPDGPPR